MSLKHNLTIITRRLLKDKLYTLVNILSLAVGLLCCLFAYHYIQFELSYDEFHDDSESIYRIEYQTKTNNGTNQNFANLHGNVLPDGITTIPEIEVSTRFAKHGDLLIQVEDQSFGETSIIAAENSFFKLFNFPFVSGDSETALSKPNSVVISESTAKKYFNSIDVLGETFQLRLNKKSALLTVSGVIKDIPNNSHFSFDLITDSKVYENLYGFSIYDVQLGYNYIKLFSDTDPNIVQAEINDLTAYEGDDLEVNYSLQPLTSIHLYSSDRGEISINSDVRYLYFLGLITLIILSIACVNFTTLTISSSIKRSTEIGIRKAHGALRSSLISNFLIEGIFLSMCGLVVAYFLLWEFLPYINSIADRSFAFVEFINPTSILLTILITISIGSLAALYPALISTDQKSSSSLLLKTVSGNLKSNRFWKGVIVAQFSATLVLISSSYIVHKQIDFIQNKDHGFEKEQIVTIPNYFRSNPDAFYNNLIDILIFKAHLFPPMCGVSKSSGSAVVQAVGSSQELTFDWISVDHNYLDLYGIDLKEGRGFSELRNSDAERNFVVNETAAKVLNMENPLGKSIKAFGEEGVVIGVVEDFNFLSLHNAISPLIMTVNKDLYFSISAKFNSTENLPETISYIEKTWTEMIPGVLFSYKFVDQQFEEVYRNEQRAQALFLIFSILAIFIAVLGLFSFATFSVNQKQKEIGIRKVLGASIYDVLKLFYNNYLKLLIFAGIIAFPIVYFWMNKWLANFSYSPTLGFEIISLPLLVAFLTIVISVSYQTIKAALANPADTIRSE